MNKKLMSILLATTMLVPMASACKGGGNGGSGSGSSTMTEINVLNFGGGVGSEWLQQAAKRFETLNAEKSYSEGKKGVKIKYDGSLTNLENKINTMNKDGNDIYFNENKPFPYELAQKGYLLDITDWVTEKKDGVSIEDKIDPAYRSSLKKGDNYYALPHYEWYPGIVYNKQVFDEKELYFAAADADPLDCIEYECPYGTAYFIAQGTKKSCGNDGIYGTADDGLPTSIEELFILCDYITSNGEIPFTVAGFHLDYTAYFETGLLASLLGYDGMMNYFNFSGEADVLTGYDSTELFDGLTGIKAPTTKHVTLTEATGNLSRDIVERYYVASAMYAINKKSSSWLSSDAKLMSTTHTDTQYDFVNKTRTTGIMMMEGSYWYNESKRADNFKPNKSYNLAWMSLPTLVKGSVAEGEGRNTALVDMANSYAYVNKNVKNRAGVEEACKDFIQFLYSDAELSAFTQTTGVAKAAMNYDITTEGLAPFQKSVLDIKKENKVVYANDDNQTFTKNRSSFIFGITAPVWTPRVGNVEYKSFLEAFKTGKTLQDCFESTRISNWSLYYEQ